MPVTRGRCIRAGCKAKQRYGLVCSRHAAEFRAIAKAAARKASSAAPVRITLPGGVRMTISPGADLASIEKGLSETFGTKEE